MKNLAWKQILLSLLIGFAAGAGISGWRHGMRDFRSMDTEVHFKRMVKRFCAKLELNAEQEKNVAAILQAKREKIAALRAEVKPRFEEIRQNAKEEIKKILNPDQQKKLDALDQKMMKHQGRRSPV